MSQAKAKHVDCPVCATRHYKELKSDIIARGKVFMCFRFDKTTPAIKQGNRELWLYRAVQRCPLCYGKGWVMPELYTAFQLKYGYETEQLEYSDLSLLRELITNYVCANDIKK